METRTAVDAKKVGTLIDDVVSGGEPIGITRSGRLQLVVFGAQHLALIVGALDNLLGDTDPHLEEDVTDDEIRRDEPLLWVIQQLNGARKPEANE